MTAPTMTSLLLAGIMGLSLRPMMARAEEPSTDSAETYPAIEPGAEPEQELPEKDVSGSDSDGDGSGSGGFDTGDSDSGGPG